MKGVIEKAIRVPFFLLILFLINQPLFGQVSNKQASNLQRRDSILNLLKDSSQIMLSFETGFSYSSITIMDKTNEVVFKGILTTIPQLSFSKRIFVRKNQFPVTIECQGSFKNLNRTEFKFIYIKRVDTTLVIDYSKKFKIYE